MPNELAEGKKVVPGTGKFEMTIDDLDLSVRACNCLGRSKIMNLDQLITMSVDELRNIRNIEEQTFREIREKLASLGLHLKGDEEFLRIYQTLSQNNAKTGRY